MESFREIEHVYGDSRSVFANMADMCGDSRGHFREMKDAVIGDGLSTIRQKPAAMGTYLY